MLFTGRVVGTWIVHGFVLFLDCSSVFPFTRFTLYRPKVTRCG